MLLAGWLDKSSGGPDFELIGDLIIGIIGAFIGDWLLPQVGIHLGTGIVFPRLSTLPLVPSYFCLCFGFCEAALAAVGAEAGADADGGSDQGKE